MAQEIGAELADMGFITMKAKSVSGIDIAHGPNSYSSSIYVNKEGKSLYCGRQSK